MLSVEDDAASQKLIHATLQLQGYEIEDAESIEEARAKLAAGDFNLVLLDLNLPDGNGLDLALEIRDTEPIAETPILILSAKPLRMIEAVAEQTEACAYLQKPIRPRVLMQKVEECLGQAS